ncbi:MAG: glycosyltransferase family 4 protein [Pseudohongiellaceae bacterium]
MSVTVVPVILLVGSFVLTCCSRFLALRWQWIDIPNGRSSHLTPTPKGGGVGFVLIFSAAVGYLLATDYLAVNQSLALSLSLVVAISGLLDDFKSLPVRIRVSVQLLAAGGVMISMGGLPQLPVFNMGINFGWVGYIIGTLGLVWLINLFNFMDGIDGLAALETGFVCLAASILVSLQGGYEDAFVLLCMLAAISGFLLLNFPPAKIFMGDVGSQYLGLTLGTLGLITIQDGYMHIWSWAILLGSFIVDSTLTLYKRLRAGKLWYHAHRTHAYQHAAIKLASHLKVDLGVTLINLCWLFPVAWFSLVYTSWAMVLTFIAYVPLIILGNFYRAGQEDI